MTRGAGGGPLFPLASQLNDDATHLPGQWLEDMLGQLADDLRQVLVRLDGTRVVAAAPVALAQLPPLAAGFTGRDDELAALAGLLDPAGAVGAVLVSAVAGLAGAGKTTLAAGRQALRLKEELVRRRYCSSTCTDTTRNPSSPPRGGMHCCGHWVCLPSTSRRPQRSGPS